MKLIIPTHHSRAIARISDALASCAPADADVARPETIRKDVHRSRQIEGEADAHLVVMLVNGLRDHFLAQAERCQRRGQKFASFPILLRNPLHPTTERPPNPL